MPPCVQTVRGLSSTNYVNTARSTDVMATSRSPLSTFPTRLALTFVVIVTLGVTGKNLSPDMATTNENNTVARSSRAAECGSDGKHASTATKVEMTQDDTTNENNAVARSSRAAECGSDGGCPVEKGYGLYNNRCLKLYNIKQDYQTATTRCQADGAHLFYFKSREQDSLALWHLLDTISKVIPIEAPGLWVGANDIKVEGQFLWSDLTCLPTDSVLWSSNQPDDTLKNEDCVEVGLRDHTVGLNDFTCTSKLEYVCQIDMKNQ